LLDVLFLLLEDLLVSEFLASHLFLLEDLLDVELVLLIDHLIDHLLFLLVEYA